jgi:phenylacetate-coenzyme A ligase PaaK-like adenylate-forming protein
MSFDLTRLPLTPAAFSRRPMTACEPAFINALAPCIDLIALETGPRQMRRQWQAAQLANLLTHAAARSAFWRARVGKSPASSRLSALPVLTREQVREQVEREGALLRPADLIQVKRHQTSGSSGVPVAFFISEVGSRQTQMRILAQYLLEGRDLSLNKTVLSTVLAAGPKGFEVKRDTSWLGPLAPYIRSGGVKTIRYAHPALKPFCQALESEPIGYLVAPTKGLELYFQQRTAADLKRAGVAMVIPLGEAMSPEMHAAFTAQDVPVRANYSCEEAGVLGVECPSTPGAYHVAESSVIVEVTDEAAAIVDGQRLGRVLVTALLSYATPFIRYDIGDLASLAARCACGRDGPTLSNVRGRSKGFLSRADGAVVPFHLRAPVLTAIASFDEYRIRQTEAARIVAEFARDPPLTEAEAQGFHDLIAGHAGPGFFVEIRSVDRIDWGAGVKRLGFQNEMA